MFVLASLLSNSLEKAYLGQTLNLIETLSVMKNSFLNEMTNGDIVLKLFFFVADFGTN
jgi:hypothetical protein